MTSSRVFNGPVETGLRSLVILLEAHPAGLDIQRLVTFDYLLVHSGDIAGGPTSLHPPSPLRAGEIAIRRTSIEQGLHLYGCRGLISRGLDSSGIQYFAEDSAANFLDALHSAHAEELRERSRWVHAQFGTLSDAALAQVLEESLGRWRVEFTALEAEGEYS